MADPLALGCFCLLLGRASSRWSFGQCSMPKTCVPSRLILCWSPSRSAWRAPVGKARPVLTVVNDDTSARDGSLIGDTVRERAQAVAA